MRVGRSSGQGETKKGREQAEAERAIAGPDLRGLMEQAGPPPLLMAHALHTHGPSALRSFLAASSPHLLCRGVAPGELELVVVRLNWSLRIFPFSWRAMSWPASRRMQGGLEACRWGCMVVGGGDIRHSVGCPCLSRVLPPWTHAGALLLALFVLPGSRAQALNSAIWVYISYRSFRAARYVAYPRHSLSSVVLPGPSCDSCSVASQARAHIFCSPPSSAG